MGDRLGQQLGNYRFVKLLGKGGFAEVYLGQHVRLASKQAAVKILHLLDVDARKFQEEAETTEKLVHPHIVRLLDFDIEQDTPFLVLDFAPGGSLRTRHPKGSIVPLATVGEYLKELASALQYAHDLHILHRDMKPDNVLIGRQRELLLSDFGIAVLSQTGRTSLEASYGIGGTPYYMAPEAYRGKPEKASDQYALAVVVYEWLCGSVPFSQGNFIQLGYQHAHEPLPPLGERNPAIPSEVEAVIMKALAKEPKDRFASVQAFATALDQASHQQQQPIVVQQPIFQEEPVLFPFDNPPGTTIEIYRGHIWSVYSVAWSPDGKHIVSGGDNSGEGHLNGVHVWEATTGKRVIDYKGHSGSVTSVAWSPDGRYIVSVSGDTQVWEAATGNLKTCIDKIYYDVTWSPDGKYIALGAYESVHVLEAATGNLKIRYDNKHSWQDEFYSIYAYSVDWSPDGRYIASSFQKGRGFDVYNTVHVWEAATGNLKIQREGSYSAWSPDGKLIASVGLNGTVHVWEVATGNLKIHKENVYSVDWSPDGKLIASKSGDNPYKAVGIQVWEVDTGNMRIENKEHFDCIYSVAWSPNGRYIASGSADKTVHVWVAPK